MGLFDKDLPCVKTPSKCIIWTGAKVYCIEICDGDTIEDVIKKIGKKLKDNHQAISIESLDFGDLLGEKECPPEKLIEVIQLLINKINNCCSSEVVIGTDNTSLTVSVAECFQETLGAEVININEYVQFLGNTICSQATQIDLLQESVENLTDLVTQLNDQVQTLIG
jgi:hypothetical protein